MYHNYNGQASCPNMAISKIGPYLRNHGPQNENNLNLGPPPRPLATHGVARECMYNFWNIGHYGLKQSAKALGALVIRFGCKFAMSVCISVLNYALLYSKGAINRNTPCIVHVILKLCTVSKEIILMFKCVNCLLSIHSSIFCAISFRHFISSFHFVEYRLCSICHIRSLINMLITYLLLRHIHIYDILVYYVTHIHFCETFALHLIP